MDEIEETIINMAIRAGEPILVKCIDNTGHIHEVMSGLTLGKVYKVIGIGKNYYKIVDDLGIEDKFNKQRFIWAEGE